MSRHHLQPLIQMRHPAPVNPARQRQLSVCLSVLRQPPSHADAHSQGEVGTEGCCLQMANLPHIPSYIT